MLEKKMKDNAADKESDSILQEFFAGTNDRSRSQRLYHRMKTLPLLLLSLSLTP